MLLGCFELELFPKCDSLVELQACQSSDRRTKDQVCYKQTVKQYAVWENGTDRSWSFSLSVFGRGQKSSLFSVCFSCLFNNLLKMTCQNCLIFFVCLFFFSCNRLRNERVEMPSFFNSCPRGQWHPLLIKHVRGYINPSNALFLLSNLILQVLLKKNSLCSLSTNVKLWSWGQVS